MGAQTIVEKIDKIDKRLFSVMAIISALLYLVPTVLIVVNDKDLTSNENILPMCLVIIASVLAIVHLLPAMFKSSNKYRALSSVLMLIAAAIFIVVRFASSSANTVLGCAAIVAGAAMVLDMLSNYFTRVYSIMYVVAILAAVEIAMGAMSIVNTYSTTYAAASFIAMAVWMVISGLTYFRSDEDAKKYRQVVECARERQKEKLQAMNKKATIKAKRFRPVTLPGIKSKSAKIQTNRDAKTDVKTDVMPAPKAEPKPVEKPAAKPAPKPPVITRPVEQPKAQPAKPQEPKQVQKAPDKAMGDFMAKLMSSQNASRATPKHTEEVEQPVVKAEEPKAEEPVKEAPEVPVEEPKVAEISDAEVEAVMKNAIDAPIDNKDRDLFSVGEPKWDATAKEKKPKEEPKVEEPKEEPKVEEPKEEPKVEEPKEEPKVEEPVVEEPVAEEEPEEEFVEDEAIEEEPEEDDFFDPTDNSPGALVRRAAWNKGLRCRKNYSKDVPVTVPVAFVSGKVALYVTEDGKPEPSDEELIKAGWTVFRFKESDITDGKEQGAMIKAEVSAKTKKKRRSKKKSAKKTGKK